MSNPQDWAISAWCLFTPLGICGELFFSFLKLSLASLFSSQLSNGFLLQKFSFANEASGQDVKLGQV